MTRLWEFFEDENGKLSSRALVVYISTITLCICLVYSLKAENPSEGIVSTIVLGLTGLVGGVVGFNKWVDGSVAKTQAVASATPATVTNAETVNVTEKQNG